MVSTVSHMKVLRVNISGFVGREVSVTALLLLQHYRGRRIYVDECGWLSPNLTWSAKTGRGQDSACEKLSGL